MFDDTQAWIRENPQLSLWIIVFLIVVIIILMWMCYTKESMMDRIYGRNMDPDSMTDRVDGRNVDPDSMIDINTTLTPEERKRHGKRSFLQSLAGGPTMRMMGERTGAYPGISNRPADYYAKQNPSIAGRIGFKADVDRPNFWQNEGMDPDNLTEGQIMGILEETA